jgi:hypothetical protein
MTAPPEIILHLNHSDLRLFYILLSKGFRIPFEPGCTIKDLLCRQLRIDDTYIRERIQTLFLDGKAVDDIHHAIVSDGSTLALSAAMPGLAGAVFRSKSRYSAMRESISYAGPEKESFEGSGTIELKLFNLVAKEIGDIFLDRGILTGGRDICNIFEDHAALLENPDNMIIVDGNKTDGAGLLSSGIDTQDVWLKVRTG